MEQSNYLTAKYEMSRWDKFVIWFCVIDALYLTYLPFVALTVSTPVIILWVFCYHRELLKDNEYIMCIFLLFIMLFSDLFGFVENSWTLQENIKVFIIQALAYQYYFLFKFYKTKFGYSVNVKRCLEAFIALGFILAIYYIIDRGGFIQFKQIVNRYDGVVSSIGSSSSSFRYNFLWTDANNPAYAFSSVLAFILIKYKTTAVEKVALIVMTFISIMASMSTGGLASFAIVLFLYSETSIYKAVKQHTVEINYNSLLALALLAIVVFIFREQILDFFSNEAFQQSLDRTSTNDDQLSFRINIWKNILNAKSIFLNALFGVGPSIVINGYSYKPHNCLLYLIYSYGWIGTYLFLRLFYLKDKHVKWTDYYYMLPLWVGFLINSVIGNPKCLILTMLMTVETRYGSNENQYSNYMEAEIRNQDNVP